MGQIDAVLHDADPNKWPSIQPCSSCLTRGTSRASARAVLRRRKMTELVLRETWWLELSELQMYARATKLPMPCTSLMRQVEQSGVEKVPQPC
jgi:hypothetical protein